MSIFYSFNGFWSRRVEEERKSPTWTATSPPTSPQPSTEFSPFSESALATPEGYRSRTYRWYLQYIVRKQSAGTITFPDNYQYDCKPSDCVNCNSDNIDTDMADNDFEAVKETIKSKALKHSEFYKNLLNKREQERIASEGLSHVERSQMSTHDHEQEEVDTSTNTSTSKTNPQDKPRQRRTGVFQMQQDPQTTDRHKFPSVEKFIIQYTSLIQQQMEKISDVQKPSEEDASTPMIDNKMKDTEELCLLPPPSGYCSSSNNSDDECRNWQWKNNQNHQNHQNQLNDVKRCCSSDSALGFMQSDEETPRISERQLSHDPSEEDDAFTPMFNIGKRGSIDHYNVPSKTIIEAQYVPFPLDRKFSDCESIDDSEGKFSSRRQSCFTDDGEEPPRYRYWRTPSVVVSDYSDDVIGGLTLEDIEYFRNQRKDLYSSPDSSVNSSCSNLNYCGSSVSILDDYTLRTPSRKTSDCSSCSTVSGDEDIENHLQPLTATVYGNKVREIFCAR